MRRTITKIISVLLVVCMMTGLVVTGNAASTAKVSTVRAMSAGSNFSFNYTSSDNVKHTHNTSTVNMRLVGTDQIVSTTGAGNYIINQGSNLKIGYCLEPNKTAANGSYEVDMTASEWETLVKRYLRRLYRKRSLLDVERGIARSKWTQSRNVSNVNTIRI